MLKTFLTHPFTKTLIAASVISFTSSLAGRRPALAGFLISLPISSLLALAFSQAQFGDSAKTVEFARSILVSVPLSLTFFLPFLFANRLALPFWALYGLGVVFLVMAYFIHSALFRGSIG